jgi:hypothetical protein
MLKTTLFEFNRKGQLTIFTCSISYSLLRRIIRYCADHARAKKIKKPFKFRFIPTLTEIA